MARTLDDDVVAMVTGFGSVLVVTDQGSTRGLWGDAEVEIDAGRQTYLTTHRVLLVATSAVTDFAIAREDTLSVGAQDDDTTRTTYRVVDRRTESDGLLTRLAVAAT
ncbi:MAG: hypothetical protein IT352_07555 [Gemmatimonadales bacterium]|nr:hypothetical protein [Gemmatimonadales bacterium]